MPELPEVETIRHDLNVILVRQKIKSIQIFSPKSVLPNASLFVKNLLNRKIEKIQRRGKLLIFSLLPFRAQSSSHNEYQSSSHSDFRSGPHYDSQPNSDSQFSSHSDSHSPSYLLIHIKMTGQLIYFDKKNKIAGGHSVEPIKSSGHSVEPIKSSVNSAKSLKSSTDSFPESLMKSVGGELPNKHTRVQIGFQNGGQLYFNDLRKFGYLKLVSAEELERLLITNYGPEPLTPAFSLLFFKDLLKNRTIKIKALLLNQKLIAGLGNIYVDESLWQAKIDPERRGNGLKPEEVKKLYQAINKIISLAIKYRGTTFSNYVDSRGQKGNFSKFLKVYGQQGQPCKNCRTILLKKKVAGRGSHYCPNCQK